MQNYKLKNCLEWTFERYEHILHCVVQISEYQRIQNSYGMTDFGHRWALKDK